MLLSFLVPTGKKSRKAWLSTNGWEGLRGRKCSDLRESFLTSNDEVRSPILKNYPGRGLNPQPVSCFGQQPEVGEATVSRLYHWEQSADVRGLAVCEMCVTDWRTHFWGGCQRSTSCQQHGWTGNQSLESPAPCQSSLKSASLWKQTRGSEDRRWWRRRGGCLGCPKTTHLLSAPRGAKSILCLVWKIKVFARISITEGGSTAVAMAKRASWAAAVLPSASLFAGRLRHFSRPLKFKAWNGKRKH